MRVTTDRPDLEISPGETASFVVNVVNTDHVIDGISARVIGLPEEQVKCQPALLPLFPDAVGQLNITIAAPREMSAGRHPIVVEVTSHGALAPTLYLELDLVVEARPQVQITSKPKVDRGLRSGRYVLEITNPGNVRLQVDLEPFDDNRQLQFRCSTTQFDLQPGRSAKAILNARARKRIITGATKDQDFQARAHARRLDQPPDQIIPDAQPIEDTAELMLKQLPIISRGLLTAFILASIVALWAGAFLLGLAKVFASDPPTKQAPASFFWLKGVTRTGTANAAFDVTAADIPGALPKIGDLPPGIASQITGTVRGFVDNQPVGRILVQAYRIKHGKLTEVSAAGTQTDGTYAVAGLFPTSYYLRFSAKGFHTVWYDGTSAGSQSRRGATLVPTKPQGSKTLHDLIIRGFPATIRGGVNPGETQLKVRTTITAHLMIGAVPQAAPYTTHTNPDTNAYRLRGLPAPGTYQITFTSRGYQSTTIVEAVSGGDVRFEPPVALSAGNGEISGVVKDATGNPIGGATVSTLVNGTMQTVVTPTIGQVGHYTLQNLPTPATYLITFSSPNYGTRTRILDLGVGVDAVKPNFNTRLSAGTGSVSGMVVDQDGAGLGGVTVTVGGSAPTSGVPPSTTTLTDGARGSFAINGLVTPGSYTLTASLPGYEPVTLAFDLNGRTRPNSLPLTLIKNTGEISGQINAACPETDCVNAKVTATNGQQSWTVGVSSPGGSLPDGGYLITGLPPGTYTVTVTDAGMQQQTAIVVVKARETTPQDLHMKRAA